jgi:IMP dehydrogenase/GMP reductase
MPLPRTPSLRPDGRCATATGTARGIGLGVPQRSIQMDCIMVGNEKRACGLQYRPN